MSKHPVNLKRKWHRRTGRKQKHVKTTGTASIQEEKDIEGGSQLSELIDVGPSPKKKMSTRYKKQNKKKELKSKEDVVEWSEEEMEEWYAVTELAESPVPGTSAESPVAGPSSDSKVTGHSEETRVQAQDSSATGESQIESELCTKCQKYSDEMLIQCDSCNAWLHRKYSGLVKIKQWRKFTREGRQWFCKGCK
ncbi:hypothetical protein DPMN_046587 [Dreissena polymorpha]|uniref:Zinc finger PHD-type domain-containing protein n=1 Tax=Dreissena polymorpha TaxID=45954 RepID=A0A9D4I106_DREPO|nr:hypothetical protein DPMN_046587 [Dreissena polymorpha]